jgi:hypothetical protein
VADNVDAFVHAFVLGDRTGDDAGRHIDRQDRLRADWPELWRTLVAIVQEHAGRG